VKIYINSLSTAFSPQNLTLVISQQSHNKKIPDNLHNIIQNVSF